MHTRRYFLAKLSASIVAAGFSVFLADFVYAQNSMVDAATPNAQLPNTVPSLALTESLLFQLLAAEIAQQRGDAPAAYNTFMRLARSTRDPRLARRALEVAISARSNPDAFAAAKAWRNLMPLKGSESIEPHLALLALAANDMALKQTQGLLEEWLTEQNSADRAIAIISMGRVARRAADKKQLAQFLETLLAPYSKEAESHLLLAEVFFNAEDKTRARQEVTLAAQLRPDSERVALNYAQYGQAGAQAGDNQALLIFLQKFLQRNPSMIDVRMVYARQLAEDKQFDSARAQFERVAQEKPDTAQALFALGLLNVQAKKWEEANSWFALFAGLAEQKPELELEADDAYLYLAQIAQEQKKWDLALGWLSKIKSETRGIEAQQEMARVYMRKGDIASARAQLSSMPIRDNTARVQNLLLEVQILREAKQNDEALSVLNAALKDYADNTDFLYERALLLEKHQQFESMENDLRAVIKLKPDNPHAYNALGYSFAERNVRLPEAHALIEQALKLAPQDPFIMDSMGWVFYRMNDLKQAADYLQRAYQQRQDAEIAAHLGEVLWQQNAQEDARTVWREAFKKEPENEILKAVLIRYQQNF